MPNWLPFTALALLHLAWIAWEFKKDRFARLNRLAVRLAVRCRIKPTMKLTWIGHWMMALVLALYGLIQAWLCGLPPEVGFGVWALGAAGFYTVREVHQSHWDLDSVMDLVGPWLVAAYGLAWVVWG